MSQAQTKAKSASRAHPTNPYAQANFQDWLQRAKPGSQHVYHVGHHLFDKEAPPKRYPVANDAWDAHEAGLVCLVQRRCEGGLEYVAIRRKPTLRAV